PTDYPRDLRGTSEQSPFGDWRGRSLRRCAVGRVDDDDSAPCGVRDPVRDVSEQKLAASGHTDVPDDEYVGVLLFGDAHDAAGNVVIDAEDRARIREGLGVRAQ